MFFNCILRKHSVGPWGDSSLYIKVSFEIRNNIYILKSSERQRL